MEKLINSIWPCYVIASILFSLLQSDGAEKEANDHDEQIEYAPTNDVTASFIESQQSERFPSRQPEAYQA